LIEDSPADADYLAESLSRSEQPKIALIHAESLSAGIAILSQRSDVDVVLLDLSLPDGSGVDTVRKFRAAVTDRPVVVLTGSPNPTLWAESLENGAQDYLLKEKLSLDTLVRSIHYAMVRKRLFDEQEERQRRLTEIDRMRNDFIQMVNHDLTTPIITVSESLARLAKDPPPTERQEYLDMARRNTDRILRLVDDLADLTRFNRGQFTLKKSRVNLRRLVRQAAQTVIQSHPGSKVTLVYPQSDSPPVFVEADPQRLDQVLTNLLQNAVQYARMRVEVRLADIGGDARIEIEDDGVGMDPVDLPHLFEKFFRGRGRGKKPAGSGLGLAIARGIMEAHGGSISAENRAQASGTVTGALFALTFPKNSRS